MTAFRFFEHPILGVVLIAGSEASGLTAIQFMKQPIVADQSADQLLQLVENRLQHYLIGEDVDFEDIPLNPVGTPFQQQVWKTLQTIPRGVTRSYKWVAQQLGYVGAASRAIGQANGKNPIPIIVPCHRVVHHDGTLGGYSGGLHIKQFLLSLECKEGVQSHIALNDTLQPTKLAGMTLL